MTVTVDSRRREYSGNGVATSFNGPMAYQPQDVQVFLTVGGVTSPVSPGEYEIDRFGRASGTRVVMNTPPPSGSNLLLLRTVPYSQDVDITNQGAFHAETIEKGFDALAMQTQQLADGLSFSVQLREDYPIPRPDLRLPDPESSLLIGWNVAGDALRNTDVSGPADLLLRSDLADPTGGGALVAFRQPGISTHLRDLAAKAGEVVSILDYIHPSQHAAIRARTSTYDCRADFQNAITDCIRNGRALYVPGGTYIVDSASSGETPIQLNMLTAHGQGLRMYGEGRGKTIIKDAAGSVSRGGRFTRTFYYWLNNSAFNPGTFEFEDITFDKSGSTNGSPPTLYGWEQSHIFSWAGTGGTTAIGGITFRKCEFVDKVGACINFSSAACVIRSIVIDDIQSTDHPKVSGYGDGTFGERGCLEFGMDGEGIYISNTTARYAQIEPTVPSSSTRRRASRVVNSKIDKTEFTDSGGFSELDVVGCRCDTHFLVRGVRSRVTNTRFRIPGFSYTLGRADLTIVNCTIFLPVSDANEVRPFAFSHVATGDYATLKIASSEILIESDDPNLDIPGYALSGSTVGSIGQDHRILNDVEFDPRLRRSIDAFANGDWTVSNCKLAGTDYAIRVGGTGAERGGIVRLNNNNFDAVTGDYVMVSRTNTVWELHVSGNYQADKWKWRNDGSGNDPQIRTFPTLFGSAAPTGYFYRGSVVVNSVPSAAGNSGWVKTNDSSTASTWKSFGSISA